MTHTQKKIDKKAIDYICLIIKAIKLKTKQRELIADFIINKPEYLLELIEGLGEEYYKIVPKA